ncbi:MAG: alpha amylase C-terminal domain-containing protein [Candidatus Onthomonas sp.]|nr:alpha amylase C-terminal domain-containing protein [Candidatus Onthomonas sp.]
MADTPSVKLHNSPPLTPDFFRQLGPRPVTREGEAGWLFRMWAPDAVAASVAGDFNGWAPDAAPMESIGPGLWECFLPQPRAGDLYKYVLWRRDGSRPYRSDPWAVSTEPPPGTASRLFDLSGYPWQDGNWIRFRRRTDAAQRPQLLYHLQIHTWRRTGNGQALSLRDLTTYLVPYLKEMGYTGAVLMADHPPFFAPPAAQDSPHDWMYLIDQLHQAGLSAFLDWHPGPCDLPVFAASDSNPPDWSEPSVQAFLVASATFWLETYHLDGLRIDAPDPIHYLDGAGTRSFFETLQKEVARHCPEAQLLLNSPISVPGFSGWQERSAQPLLDLFQGKASVPSEELTSGDLLALPARDFQTPHPAYLDRFSGTVSEKRAAARACYLALLALPGGKLVSMGTELGQGTGWRSGVSLDWHLLNLPDSQTHHVFFQAANALYLTEPVLRTSETQPLQWIPAGRGDPIALAFLRRDSSGSGILCLCNPTAAPFSRSFLSLPEVGICQILLSSEENRFGGAGTCSISPCSVSPEHPSDWLQVSLPPTTCVLIRYIPARGRDSQNASPPDGPHSR